MENTNEIAVREAHQLSAPQTAANIRAQVNLIQEVMKEVMQGPSDENPNGIHYGTIPGCGDKPTLLKPGAEKLFLTFRLRPIIDPAKDVIITELQNGHRDYRVHCHILNMAGVEMATGVGSASTMESKHRYRGGEKKSTGKPVPKEYWNLHKEGKIKEAMALIGGAGFATGKIDGAWVICEKGEKMENPDIADQYNTVLKMAAKRAKVDGCLSATACSDIFTQDIEDFHDVSETVTVKAAPATQKESAPMPQRKSAQPQAEATAPAPQGQQAASGEVKSATGKVLFHNPPKGASVFHTFVLDGFKGFYFGTDDEGKIETLDAKMEEGEVVSIEYTEKPWSKNGKSGINRHIVGLSVQQEAAPEGEKLPF